MTINDTNTQMPSELGSSSAERAAEMRVPSIPDDGLLDHAVGAALWALGGSYLIPSLSVLTALSHVMHPKKFDALGRLYCRGQIALTGSRWRTVVHPDVRPDGAYVFAQNHTNHLDHVALYPATPHFKQGLELETHFKYPFYGWFMKARGTIPVRKGQIGQSPEILSRIRDEIAAGHSIVAFPEGTRTKTGRVGPFRNGMFFVARELSIPIVPVAVTGTWEMMRKGSWLIRPGSTITVYVEQPVDLRGLSDDGVREAAKHTQTVVARRVDDYYRARGLL